MHEFQSVLPAANASTPQAAPAPAPTVSEVPNDFSGTDYFQALEAARRATEAPSKPADDKPTKPTDPTSDAPKADAKPADDTTPGTPADTDVDPLEQVLERATAPKRDYTGLSEKEAKLFKNMSNEAYAELRPMYDEWKKAGFDPKKLSELQAEAESLRKYRYVDHPRAFELSEEYEQARTIAENIQTVNNYWRQQLTELRANRPVSLLVRDAKGRLVPGTPTPATPDMEAHILEQLTKSATDYELTKREIEQLQASYKSQYDEYGTTLGSVHTQIFGKHEAALKPVAEKYLEKFPKFVRHKPEIKLAAYALAAVVVGSNSKTTAANAEVVDKAVKAAAASAGPSLSSIKTGTVKESNAPGFSPSEYEQFKRQHHIY